VTWILAGLLIFAGAVLLFAVYVSDMGPEPEGKVTGRER